jgi:anti-sigma factor RsiW
MRMRCTTARKIMVASLDGAARDDERDRLVEHLAGCAACRHEQEQTRRLALAMGGLAAETEVPGSVEDALMRRLRRLEGDGPTVAERLRGWLPAPVLVAAAAVALALVVLDVSERPGGAGPGAIALPRAVVPAPARLASAGPPAGGAMQLATAESVEPPVDPPADLRASLPLLLDMSILRNMEKLENFDRIEALTLADDGGSNG